jgi:hypothetical protein
VTLSSGSRPVTGDDYLRLLAHPSGRRVFRFGHPRKGASSMGVTSTGRSSTTGSAEPNGHEVAPERRANVVDRSDLQRSSWMSSMLPLSLYVILRRRGGVRFEDFTVDIDDFQQNPAFGGRSVRGGTLDYDATTFNIGGVVSAAEGLQVFAGFNQGFSITQVGRLLVNTLRPSVADARPEPSEVDSYEVGLRSSLRRTQLTVAGFYSTSDLGTSLVARGIGPPEVIRAPERTYGSKPPSTCSRSTHGA